MESQVQLTIVKVTSRLVKRRSDNREFTMYDVQMGDGNTYCTSKREVAEDANRLTGQLVLATIKVEQNGEWTNRYIQFVSDMNGAGSQPIANQSTGLPIQTAQPASTIPDTTADTDIKKSRGLAAKVSAEISATPAEFWQNLDPVMAWMEHGVKPSGFEAAAIAATDDDIPF